MNKKLNIIILLIITLILSSCFWSQDDVSKAKQELLNQENSIENDKEDEGSNVEKLEEKKEKVIINYLDENKFIELDSLNEDDIDSMELEIKWKTLVNVDKIIVNFSNDESNFPIDSYELKTFKSWDESFLYRAFIKYETLDYGENKYVIEAYSWTEISKLELIINVEDKEKTSDSKNDEIVTTEVNLSSLPVWWDFWNPVNVWLGKFTYSDIKWLQVEKLINANLTLDSDSVNEFLADRIDWWFFWNSLRPVSWEEWVSFYLIRLEWDKYFYEKHYYTNSWFYWVLVLENWSWIDLNWLSEKNTQLKEKNIDFTITTISDKLFKKL